MRIIKDDDRYLDPAGVAMALEQKAQLETWNQSARILEGTLRIEERGPKELRPDVPDELKGSLLWGMKNMRRVPKTREEQIKDYKMLVRMGYLSESAPCRVTIDGETTIVDPSEL